MKTFLVKQLSIVFPETVEAAQEGQRQAHQNQEHLTDAEMAKPEAMKTYAAFKR